MIIVLLIIAWLAFGVTTVAVAKRTGMYEFVKDDCERVCTLVLWPIAVVGMALIGLARLGNYIGRL